MNPTPTPHNAQPPQPSKITEPDEVPISLRPQNTPGFFKQTLPSGKVIWDHGDGSMDDEDYIKGGYTHFRPDDAPPASPAETATPERPTQEIERSMGDGAKQHYPHTDARELARYILSLESQLKSMTDQFLAVSGQLGEARKKQPINTHVRLFDLVRYMRAELHAKELITDDEYAWLCGGANMSRSKEGGSPSPRRLEDYDALRAENKALAEHRDFLIDLMSAFEWHRINSMTADEVEKELLAEGYTKERLKEGLDKCRAMIDRAMAARAHLAQSDSPGAGVKGEGLD